MLENLIFICLLFLPLQCVNLSATKECHPLSFDGLISCENSRSSAVNDCRGTQPVGTIAKYSCKPHYILQNVGDTFNSGNNNKLECGQNGSWIGFEKLKSTMCEEECGRRLTNPHPLIVNGKPTNSTAWPWHVALFRRMESEFVYICGGTIISRSTILTAAHCVANNVGQKLLPNTTLVILGAITSNFTQNRLGKDTQIIEVKEIYVSQNYDVKKEFQADIAVLHLSKHIEYTDHVSPICLPMDFAVDTNAVRPGSLGDVVGFGIDENGHISQNLKHGVLEIKSNTECFISLDRILSESQFCAGSPRGDVRVSACNGDSGGGLTRPSLLDQKYYIHGIVSTGDSNPRKQLICESHAVFTRVYTFIFWIRDILKEIKDNVLHLRSRNGILHRQSGTEEERGRFLSINEEWKNKVTAIELYCIDIDPDILLKSLDYSKRLKSINFTNIKFTTQFPRQERLVLPLLKTFSLDILRTDFDLALREDRRFPMTLSKEFLKSLVFFEKEIEDDESLDITRIPSLKTNVDITVHIFKLLKIHHEQGTIMLSQIPFSNEILANIPPDFKLKKLALSRTHVSPSLLTSSLITNVENLVLDEVSGIQAQDLSQSLKGLTGLNEFVFILPKSDSFSEFNISLDSLPKSIKHLALTRAGLLISEITAAQNSSIRVLRETSNSSFIIFSDHVSKIRVPLSSDKLRNKLIDVETFYCDSCLSHDIVNPLHVLNTIFPKLKHLVLKIDADSNLNINLTSELGNFNNLEFVLLNASSSLKLYSKKNKNANWQVRSSKNSYTFFHFEFLMNRKDNFWSSEADYIVGKRLRSYEKLGFKSGHYQFNGGLEERRDFLAIPRQIQKRLHSIQIANTALSKKVLEESIKYAKEVESLRIINATFPDTFIRKLVELPNLVEYVLDRPRILNLEVFRYKTVATIRSNQFTDSIPFREENDIDLKKNFLSSKVNKYYITYGNCVMVAWNKMEGTLTSSLAYTSEWLKHANTNQFIHIKTLVFQYWELDHTVVPSTITQLNLNFAIVKDMGMILRRLSSLRNLKLINVRVKDEENYKNWDWVQIDMQDLSKHSNTLEYLALEKAHLHNYRMGMKFEKVEFVYLESCTFEKSFVRNFMATFPELKRLAILRGINDDRGNEIYLDAMILQALRGNTVEWILMSYPAVGSSPTRARKEINALLDRIGIREEKNDSKYYILERASNAEAWNRISNSSLDESMIESQLLEMKGVGELGIEPHCHASSFVEKKAGEPSDLLYGEFFEDFLST